MLFQTRFHAGLVNGSITVTFRSWKTARVHLGRRYRVPPIGFLEVLAIERVAWRDVGDDDARQAGFDGLEELRTYVLRQARDLDETTEFYRVSFRYAGKDTRSEMAMDDDLADDRLAELTSKINGIDARSRRGPWAWRTLELIAERPGVVSRELGRELGREARAFKGDVRKLKELGLTVSLEVGYEISPRGSAVLRYRRKPQGENPGLR